MTTRTSEHVISEQRAVSDFDRVILSGIGHLIIEQGDEESLIVKADEDVLPMIKTVVRDGELRIGLEHWFVFMPFREIRYHLKVKNLTAIMLGGAGAINASRLQGEAISVDITGAGSITLSGTIATQTVAITGVGSYHGAGLEGQAASVRCSGAGSATVNVSDTLDVRITGAGSVEYIGSPRVRKWITGVGSLHGRK
ncbi:MAG TPA: head GIN domain-containing protein [Aggregatilineales bacterium]|nr:head GIN domain-containing protein [Aggregatilineales bacterium]